MIAAWQVRPPRLVTIAEARFMIGSQSGSVMSATSTSPSLNSCICSIEVITRTAPAPIFWPIARPSTIDLALLVHPEPLAHAGARHHRLGPRLQDVELAVEAVLAPLDVHRALVVLLDGQRLPGQLLDLGVGEAEQRPLGLVGVDELGGLPDVRVVGVDHLDRLGADAALEHRGATGAQGGLVDVELVGVHGALDHRLAQAVGRGHEHRVVEAGLGVHREHHAGRADVGADHLLHAGRQRDRVVVEVVVHAVGDRAVVVERGEHLADRLQHAVDALDVQEGLLLAGERGVGQVLGGGAGAYGEGDLVAPVDQALVRRADVGLEVLGERLVGDLLADRLADLGQRPGVVGVEVLELAARSSRPGRCRR